MKKFWIIPLILCCAGTAWAQKGKALPKKQKEAYDKAMEYMLGEGRKAPFAAKMIFGFTLLADGEHQAELEQIVTEACAWKNSLKFVSKHGTIWYPALAGLFLSEYYKWKKDENVKKAMEELLDYYAENQEEETGGWFKWKGGGFEGYSAQDLAFLTSTVYSAIVTMKKVGIKVPAGMISRADQNLMKILGGGGLGYGTGNGSPDKTAGRVGMAMLGVDYAGQKSHRLRTTAATAIPNAIPRMDQGHHWGGLHCFAVTMASYRLGSPYGKLVNHWLNRLIAKQTAQGGIYVGDDGDAGGEVGLLGGDHSSTAAVMLMMLLQDRDRLNPKKDPKKAKAKDGKPARGGGSPFSRKAAPKKENQETPSGKK